MTNKCTVTKILKNLFKLQGTPMGNGTLRERSCTIQYPIDTYLLLELSEVMTSPVILFLIAVGAYHTGRFIATVLLPQCSRWAQSAWRNISVRVQNRRNQRSPTIRNSPRRNQQLLSPRHRPENAPGSLAILTPARDPPPALITALNDYQKQAGAGPDTPRSRKQKPRS